jgi:hypothetical protein
MIEKSFCSSLILLAFLVGVLMASVVSSSVWRNNLLQRGVAIYCPLDGRFAFVGECAK